MPSPFTFRTKAKGVWATFQTQCAGCGGVLTITNGREDPHDCQPRRPVTLADIRAALGK